MARTVASEKKKKKFAQKKRTVQKKKASGRGILLRGVLPKRIAEKDAIPPGLDPENEAEILAILYQDAAVPPQVPKRDGLFASERAEEFAHAHGLDPLGEDYGVDPTSVHHQYTLQNLREMEARKWRGYREQLMYARMRQNQKKKKKLPLYTFL